MFKPTKLDSRRVQVIGDAMLKAKPGATSACCVDADGGDGKYTGKADWYVEQFRKLYPSLIIVGTFPGQSSGITVIKLEAPPFRKRPSNN